MRHETKAALLALQILPQYYTLAYRSCNECRDRAVPPRHLGAKWDSAYSSYSFLTSEIYGGEWPASEPERALPPGKDPRYSTQKLKKKNF